MKYKEIIDDLFLYKTSHFLAHCISSDISYNSLAMSSGIVVKFNDIYDMKNKIRAYTKTSKIKVGEAIVIDNVFNLVTKRFFFLGSSYKNIEKSIIEMKNYCKSNNVKKLAIPAIGCGIDGLKWGRVSEIIKNHFYDCSTEILVCFYNQKEWNKHHNFK